MGRCDDEDDGIGCFHFGSDEEDAVDDDEVACGIEGFCGMYLTFCQLSSFDQHNTWCCGWAEYETTISFPHKAHS
jgi:hypothetical protein